MGHRMSCMSDNVLNTVVRGFFEECGLMFFLTAKQSFYFIPFMLLTYYGSTRIIMQMNVAEINTFLCDYISSN